MIMVSWKIIVNFYRTQPIGMGFKCESAVSHVTFDQRYQLANK